MSLKCQKCNIRYSRGKFCGKCGSVLTEIVESSDTEENTGDLLEENLMDSVLIDEVIEFQEKVEAFENALDEENTNNQPSDVIEDYWSKTEDLVLNSDVNSDQKSSENIIVKDDTININENGSVDENKNGSGEFVEDTKNKLLPKYFIIGILVLIAVLALIFFFFYKGMNNPDDGSANENTSQTITEAEETTEDIMALKKDLNEQLNNDILQINQAIEKFHTDLETPNYLFASKGRLYSVTGQQYLGIEMLGLKDVEATDLYAKEDYLLLGSEVANEFSYITYNKTQGASELKSVKDKKVFLETINYVENLSEHSVLLPENDEDRELIKKTILDNNANYEDLIFRYVASDGTYAFAIASPSNSYQDVGYYYLHKKDNNWSIGHDFSDNADLYSMVDAISKDGEYNLEVLPPINPSDFEKQVYTADNINEIVTHLYARELVSDGAQLNFFSKINDNAYLEFSDGKCILILFQEESTTLYNDILVKDKSEDKSDFVQKMKPADGYSKYFPIHVMVQP